MRAPIASLALPWLALAVYAACLYPFTGSPEAGGSPDTPIYLLMADYLAAFPGEPSRVAREVMAQAMFPPLHPLLLGLLGGSRGIAATHAFTATCLLAALVAMSRWLAANGTPRWQTWALPAFFALSPATLLVALESLSENLYLLLSLLHLLAFTRATDAAASAEERRAALPFAALFVGLAVLSRSAGVALLVAFAAGLILRRAPGRVLWPLAAGTPIAAWLLVKPLAGFAGTYGTAYASRLASLSPDHLEAAWRSFAAQIEALAGAWVRVFALHPSGFDTGIAVLVGVLAVAGCAWRLRERRPDAIYVLLYLGVIVAWPFPAHATRFLYVVTPMLLLFAVDGAARVAALGVSREPWKALAQPALVAVIAAILLPSLGFFGARYAEARGTTYEAYTHTPRWYTRRQLEAARIDAMERRTTAEAQRGVARLVEPTGCIFATEPIDLMLLSGRRATRPPPAHIDDASFDAYIERCEYFFLSRRVIHVYRTPFYPMERLGDRVVAVRAFLEEELPTRPAVAVLVKRVRTPGGSLPE